MITRLEALKTVCSKYPLQKQAQKLKESEFDLMIEFIEENDHLGHLEFEYAVNRMYFSGGLEKTKNFVVIQEILASANALAKMIPRNRTV